MKKLFLLLIFIIFFAGYSQKKISLYTFNNVSDDELKMKIYTKDSTTNAVVLFEYGNTIIENKNDQIYLKTTVYKKIKILNKEGENHATVKVYIYNNDKNQREKIKQIKAITHNLNEPITYLHPKHIYTTKINKNWKEVTFTFPNIKSGSVLEYQYDLESEFFFNFKGWTFQSDIPKIRSEFHALIPGNWIYNRQLRGNLKLATNEATIKKKCIIYSSRKHADCEKLTYIMKDIPAFITEEKFTTTKNNYISQIKFELAEIFYLDGTSKKITTSWEETDMILKKDEGIGNELYNKSFFASQVSPEIIENKNGLDKTKAIYNFIKNHYALDTSKTFIFSDVNVKSAFKKKIGGYSEINLSLINALKAIGIDAKIMLTSTRDNGFPTKSYPVITDFNYIIAYVKIGDKDYLLDATDKNTPFNMLPFNMLNSYGRVLDFKNGSYWKVIAPQIKSFSRTSLEIDLNNDVISGKLKIVDNGYFAIKKRDKIKSSSVENYLLSIENESKNLTIEDYKNLNLNDLDKPLIEEIEIEFEDLEVIGDMIYFNPFINKISQNPFLLKERVYTVDFGYKRKNSSIIKIITPKGYSIKSLPETIKLSLPNKGGMFICSTTLKDNEITIFSQYSLNKTMYSPQEYHYLKEFYNQIIKTQNSLITLEKTNI